MSDVGLVDNVGHRISHPLAVAPELASGETFTTNGSTNTNSSDTVVSGRTYAVTNTDKTDGVLFGIATTATAANVLWAGGPWETIIITIPEGQTTLHHQSVGTSIALRVRKLALTSALT